jgi:pimeloyl-ACP methyl ester carboxylesterase
MAIVVLVHGGGGGAWEWDFWHSELESRGYLFRPIDLKPSGGRYESTSLEDYVQQIVLFAQKEAANNSSPHVDILIGASMGGILVLKACELLCPRAVILVCSCIPAGVPSLADISREAPGCPLPAFPSVVSWANGDFQDTVACLPGDHTATSLATIPPIEEPLARNPPAPVAPPADGDDATRNRAHGLWRDESGAVLAAVLGEVVVVKPPVCPSLCIIPDADDTVPPAR